MIEENDIEKPKGINYLSNNEIMFGEIIPPFDKLKLMNEASFEDFINEWAFYLKNIYVKVKTRRGSGDKGRDVIGVHQNGKEDIFQCKHYKSPLSPSEMWIEFGKLCYYTLNEAYKIPLKYYLVSPLGVGPKLGELIDKPEQLKKGLLDNWENSCKTKITKSKEIPLTDDIIKYISDFDFSIIDTIEPNELIEQHRNTPFFARRFGGGLQKHRDLTMIQEVSDDIRKTEIVYVNEIYRAYEDYLKVPIEKKEDFESNQKLMDHFQRQRNCFYFAETLEQFSRDALPPGSKAFDNLKDEIHEQVIDVCDEDYPNGYIRLKKTIQAAKTADYSSNPLSSELKSQDKTGVCHHLVNEKRLKWVSNE